MEDIKKVISDVISDIKSVITEKPLMTGTLFVSGFVLGGILF